jgi:hypothetical protein
MRLLDDWDINDGAIGRADDAPDPPDQRHVPQSGTAFHLPRIPSCGHGVNL